MAPLTSLRFFAATTVVLFHFGATIPLLRNINVPGTLMVTFFFVLSGFVMGATYFDRSNFNTAEYWWARAVRIVPIYWVALAATAFELYVENHYIDKTALIVNATLLQAWISPFPLTANYTGWSLSVEMLFYVLFPFVFAGVKRREIRPKSLVLIALVVYLTCQSLRAALAFVLLRFGFDTKINSFGHDLLNYWPPLHLSSFLLGIAGGHWSARGGRLIAPNRVLVGSLLAVGCMFQCDLASTLPLKAGESLGAYAPLFLLIQLGILQSRAGRFLTFAPLLVLGEASYGIYILQVPIHSAYRHLIAANRMDATTDFIVFFGLLCGLSIISYKAFEQPLIISLRRQFNKAFDHRLREIVGTVGKVHQ